MNIRYKKCDQCQKEATEKEARGKWILIRCGGLYIIHKEMEYSTGFDTLDFCSSDCLRLYLANRIDEIEKGERWLDSIIRGKARSLIDRILYLS